MMNDLPVNSLNIILYSTFSTCIFEDSVYTLFAYEYTF